MLGAVARRDQATASPPAPGRRLWQEDETGLGPGICRVIGLGVRGGRAGRAPVQAPRLVLRLHPFPVPSVLSGFALLSPSRPRPLLVVGAELERTDGKCNHCVALPGRPYPEGRI